MQCEAKKSTPEITLHTEKRDGDHDDDDHDAHDAAAAVQDLGKQVRAPSFRGHAASAAATREE